MLNVDAVLSAKKVEKADVTGVAESVLEADRMAWQALEDILAADPVAMWALKAMSHEIVQMESGAMATKFTAEFLRKPDEE